MKYNFKNKVVLVTASTKGIGFAIAEEFLANDAKVIICSSNKSNIQNANKILIKKYDKKNFLILKCNLEKPDEILRMINQIKKKFSPSIDILINNSGGPKVKNIINTNVNDWQRAIKINLLSTIIVTKLLLPKMIKKKWGRIINLTSSTAKEPVKGMSLSNVTRAGVVSFGKTLSKELSGSGITVNNILTGGVLTDRLKKLLLIRSKNNNTKLSSLIKKVQNDIPSGYLVKPKEFAKIIVYLCSNDASYINGIALNIDGGTSVNIT